MKRLLLIGLAIAGVSSGFSQLEGSSFTNTGRGAVTSFATDYQAIGINPANLGWEYRFDGKQIAVGANEFSYSLHSTALTKDTLRGLFSSLIRGENQEFTQQQKIQAAQDFANEGLAMNLDYGSIGAAYMNEKIGGIGFRINDRVQWYSILGPTASELLFEGRTASYFDVLNYVEYDSATMQYDTTQIQNHDNIDEDSLANVVSGMSTNPFKYSTLLEGTQISFNWIREYNLSYGRRVIGGDESAFSLYAGVGVKFVQGIAMIDIESDGETLTAFSAMSPGFDIDYGSAALSNPSALPNQTSGLIPNPVGKGWGFDFGVNAVIGQKLKIGMAVTNIGSVTWDGNVYSARDTLLTQSTNPGLNGYNIFNQLDDVVGDNGPFAWDGLASRKVSLPTMVRAGASLIFSEKAEIGVDLLLPTNEVPGSIEGAMFAFGGDITPIPWLNLSAGFVTGGNYDFQIPCGITFVAGGGTWEAGVASRDAITFFVKNGPTLSLSMGFMRFRF